MPLTRKEIFDIIKCNLKAPAPELYGKIEEVMSTKVHPLQFTLTDKYKGILKFLFVKLKTRWNASHRMETRFYAENDEWLKVFVQLYEEEKEENNEANKLTIETKNSTTLVRQRSAFIDISDRHKRRRVQSLRENTSTEELAYAAHMNLREVGKADAAYVVKSTVLGSPSKGTKYRKSIKLLDIEQKDFTPDEAVSLYVELNFSRNKYQQLRNACLSKSSKLFPSVKKLNKARRECYPDEKFITSKDSVEIKIQALLYHTIQRIIKSQNDVIECLPEEQLQNLTLIGKWGLDGSSGYSIYKQEFEFGKSDQNLFFTAFVPLQLIYKNPSTCETTIVWQNRRSSSPRFCRPIKMQFAKETDQLIQDTTNYVQKQLDELEPYTSTYHRKTITVKFQLCLTMIDQKICNSLMNVKSAQRCFVCLESISNFNKIDHILQLPIQEEALKFGLSTLHAWIRCFECLLHVSYKLDIKRWQLRQNNADDKRKVELAKQKIQHAFKQQLHLTVDMPKAGRAETSNDGNTARIFFQNSEIAAQITGLDKELIDRFHVILQVISCGFEIDIEVYEKYALETARRFVELYDWYYMPTAVHKLLMHGRSILNSSLLPIGQLSEEAQEACNKLFREFRLRFARKNYREKTLEDIFKRFLEMSDPLISNCRPIPQKPLKSLSQKVLQLLKPPSAPVHGNINEQLQLNDSSTSESGISNLDSDYDEEFLY